MTFGYLVARHAFSVVAAISTLTMIGGAPIQAQQNPAEPRARAALEQMLAAYKALDAYHIRVKWTANYRGAAADDFPPPGPDELELKMQRPNKFFMSAATKQDGKTWSYRVVSDGTSLWFWRSSTNTYMQAAAPSTLSGMVKLLPDDAIGTHTGNEWNADSILEWDLLAAGVDPALMWTGTGLVMTLGPPEQMNNTAVDVIQLKTPAEAVALFGIDTTSTIYLSSASHLVRALRMVMRGKHPDTGKDFAVTMQADYQLHDSAPRLGVADFTFTPPPGAKRVGR
jgi:hypothetical protein